METNVIYNEDCLVGLKKIPDDSIDLILTSPPYNIGIKYDTWDDNMDWDEYYKWCESWLKECYRVLKPNGGRIALNHYLSLGNSEYRTSPISELYSIMNRIGYKHHSIAIWEDITLSNRTAWGSFQSASSPYVNSPFEGVILDYKHLWKKDTKGISTIDKENFIKMTRGIWKIKTETKGLTIANFSIDFAYKIINLLTYENDIVLDPFMGSGTTAIACIKSKRNYIGCEISNNYYDISIKRIDEERNKLTLF